LNITLALLADYANMAEGGKLNVLGIFDRIYSDQVPAVHPQMHLVLRLEASPAERGTLKQQTVHLIDDDGGEILKAEGQIEISSDQDRWSPTFDQILALNNVIFPKFGSYSFHVLINGDEKARIPVRLIPLADVGGSAITGGDGL
jgi:hypothetical protein